MKKKILLFLSSCFVLACGRIIIDESVPSFSPPAIRSISNLGNNRVKIDWFFDIYQEPIIKGFSLERSENNGVFKIIIDNIPPNQRSIELAEPFGNGKVSFRISSKTTTDTTASIVASYFTPKVPSTLFCNALSATLLQGTSKPNVYLSWKSEANSINYAGNYLLQRSSGQLPFKTIGTIKTKYFLDTNVVANERYIYVVRLATNNCISNEIPMTITTKVVGLCPQNFKASLLIEKTTKSVLLSWDAQLSDFSTFYVWRANQVDGVFENITRIGIRTTVFEDKTNLQPNTNYFYKINTQISSQPPNSCETAIVTLKN